MAEIFGEKGTNCIAYLHCRYTLPAVVRVVKGQYCGLGASSGNPLSATSNLQSNLLLVGLGKKKRIVGQCVKFKDKDGKKKVVPVGPKLAIPSTYDGFFEILSEDGRAVRCIESVPELARRYIKWTKTLWHSNENLTRKVPGFHWNHINGLYNGKVKTFAD